MQKNYIFTNNWFDSNRDTWCKYFLYLKTQENHILEIGSYEGASTTWLLDKLANHPKSTMITIDVYEDAYDEAFKQSHKKGFDLLQKHFIENVRQSANFSKLKIIKKKSSEALRAMSNKNDGYFNFIYIDGSHIASDVLMDSIYSWPMLKVGGILVFDDYKLQKYTDSFDTAKPAIDGFLASFKPQIKLIYKENQVFIQKISRTIPMRVNQVFSN